MKLKSNSWYAWYYKQFYNTYYLPESLCTFFWGMILAIVLFVFIYPILIFRKIFKDDDYPTILGGLLWFIGLIGSIPLVALFNLKHSSILNIFWLNPLGLILISLVVGTGLFVIFVIVSFIQWVYNKFKKVKVYKEPNNWFSEGIKSFFGKYCPRITWK